MKFKQLKFVSTISILISLFSCATLAQGFYSEKMFDIKSEVELILDKAQATANRLQETELSRLLQQMKEKIPAISFIEPGPYCGNSTRAYTIMLGDRNHVALCPMVLDQLPLNYLPQLFIHELVHSVGYYGEDESTYLESALFLYAGLIPALPHDRAYGHDHSQRLQRLQTRLNQEVFKDQIVLSDSKLRVNLRHVSSGQSSHCAWKVLKDSSTLQQQVQSIKKYHLEDFHYITIEFETLKMGCRHPDGLEFFIGTLKNELSEFATLSSH